MASIFDQLLLESISASSGGFEQFRQAPGKDKDRIEQGCEL